MCFMLFLNHIVIEGKQVADLGGGHAINYSAYKMPPLISSRDFITLSFGTNKFSIFFFLKFNFFLFLMFD